MVMYNKTMDAATTKPAPDATAAAIERRVADYQSHLCDLVRAGEISDLEANELAAAFQDRMVLEGPWG